VIVDITVGMSEGLDESLAGRLLFFGKGVDVGEKVKNIGAAVGFKDTFG